MLKISAALGLGVMTAALSLAGCEDKKDTDTVGADNINAAPNESERGTGCIQGVVVNGLTHERVKLDAGKIANSIYMVTPGRLLTAVAAKTLGNSVTSPALEGEYYICDVPVLSSFPLYVKVEGYQEFFAVPAAIGVPGTRSIPIPGAGTTIEKFWATPVRSVDLRVFPVSALTGDYKVTLQHRGAPVALATVRLVPSNAALVVDALHPAPGAGTYATANNQRMQALTATTDANGVATFPAASLIFGGQYDLFAYHPQIADAAGTLVEGSLKRTGVVVGDADSTSAAGDAQPFALSVSFTDNDFSANLILLSQSNQTTGTPSELIAAADGHLTLRFNRDVQKTAVSSPALVTAAIASRGVKADGTACGATYTLSDPAVEVAGSVVTVTPSVSDTAAFEAAKGECKGIRFTYTVSATALRSAGLPEAAYAGGAFQVLITDE